ncbi:hypothetical protein GMO_18210 [Gluconobacter morbifer G707]|uniref:Impact N-terminal domain-containing protein n=1 Tax=Gluconobacter morbifer G707 TaxID=1088869 RepID=G6XJE9_9PROT|nr:hypothetical protein GMO_18210 [Gluconobacter morbifer G707]
MDGFAEHESVIRNSVFCVRAAPVPDETAALAFLEEVTVADATHNCWAFRTGQRFRTSDDGEPSGTAGRPILSAIDGQDFDNVMVVVTRWFGGVKLGAGGLVRAYGGAASACLREAARLELVETRSIRFHCAFSDYSLVEARYPGWGASRTECDFDATGAWMTLAVPVENLETVLDALRDMTRGQMAVQVMDI